MNDRQKRFMLCDVDAMIGHLAKGELVVFPTDTIYSLSADATVASSFTRLQSVKKRSAEQAIAVLVENVAMAQALTHWTEEAQILAEKAWPGALTMVLEKSQDCPVCDPFDKIGVRCADHPVTQALLMAYNKPLYTTSVNRHGMPAALDLASIDTQIATQVAGCMDGISAQSPSTVVDMTGGAITILRKGRVSEAQIRQWLGQ
jgi:L-threonylcarbamoyladenylate synthase